MLCLALFLNSCGSETSEETSETAETIQETTSGNAEKEETTKETESTGSEEAAETSEETEKQGSTVKEFTVQAIRFGFTPNTITVQKGDEVHITIESLDTTHGMKIPELGVSGDTSIEFVATKAGTFTWYCNNFCGSGHSSMKGTLIVEDK